MPVTRIIDCGDTMVRFWKMMAGHEGLGSDCFYNRNLIAIYFHKLGEVNLIGKDQTGIFNELNRVYAGNKKINVYDFEIQNFLIDMRPHDVVVYKDKHNKMLRIGEVTSDPIYDNNKVCPFPLHGEIDFARHYRKIDWVVNRDIAEMTEEYPEFFGKYGTLHMRQKTIIEITDIDVIEKLKRLIHETRGNIKLD